MHNPASTFGLTIQPEIMSEFSIGNKRRFRGTGTLARFAFSIPESNVGKRDVSKRDPIPETVKKAYQDGIFGLLDIPPLTDEKGVEMPRILTLASDALADWIAFSQYVEANQGDGQEFSLISDWTGKLPGLALRIAGIFHAVEFEDRNLVINRQTMTNALDLSELLIQHAQAAFSLIGADHVVEDAKAIFQWIYAEKLEVLKRSECHLKFRTRFQKVDKLKKALENLCDRNILGAEEKLSTKKPTIIYPVNPKIYQENANGMA